MARQDLTTIDFHGTKLQAIPGDSLEAVRVAIKPMSDAMGLNWSGQFTKLKEHPVLGPRIGLSQMRAADGKIRPFVTLPLSMVPGWLTIINANKVAPALQPKIILFQLEAFPAIFDHFFRHEKAPAIVQPNLSPEVIGGIVKGILAKQFGETMKVITEQGQTTTEVVGQIRTGR
jgi:hypothetical protein